MPWLVLLGFGPPFKAMLARVPVKPMASDVEEAYDVTWP